MSGRHRVAALVAWLITIAVVAPAAAEPGLVSVEVSPCTGEEVDSVRRIVLVELGSLVVDADYPESDEITSVRVSCRDSLVWIEVEDPMTGKSLARRVNLESLPAPSRARMLGLAVAELVVASWVELEVTPTPALPAVGATAPTAARGAAAAFVRRRAPQRVTPEEQHTWLVTAAAGQRWFTSGVSMNGISVQAAYRLGESISLLLDTSADMTTQPVRFGRLDIQALSAAPKLAVHTRIDRLTLAALAGMRWGIVHIRGHAEPDLGLMGQDFTAPWGGAMIAAEARVRATSHLSVRAGIEAGAVIAGVAANVINRTATQLSGGWGSFWFGAGVEF